MSPYQIIERLVMHSIDRPLAPLALKFDLFSSDMLVLVSVASNGSGLFDQARPGAQRGQ
jgi:hypothetical protein